MTVIFSFPDCQSQPGEPAYCPKAQKEGLQPLIALLSEQTHLS